MSRRSREGAWIEMLTNGTLTGPGYVAPVRERGLKFIVTISNSYNHSRSREGAWIEIALQAAVSRQNASRSREGAWIEISILRLVSSFIIVAPVRERGLK